MPSKMFYSTINAEVLRMCRATSGYTDFLISCRKLLVRMMNQGAKPVGMKRFLLKMMERHWSDFKKFFKNAEAIVLDIV